MRFEPTADQRDFAASLDRLVASSDPVAVARAWAAGDHEPGRKLWRRLAEQGVTALVVPESAGGLGATPVELVVAFEVLGRHAVPGPWVESAAYLPLALADADSLAALAEGAMATVAVPPHTPYALDADVADQVFAVADGRLTPVEVGGLHRSVDPARRLFATSGAAGPTGVESHGADQSLPAAFDLAALATAAQLLGLGERLLEVSVAYVRQRRQFGREIGSYQAVKHRLADVRIALDFARPLLHGAALATDDRARDVSAAAVACGDAAYLAARTALQVHGAVGYTRELDLSLWLLKVRALVTAWGTPAFHRQRVLASLVTSPDAAGRR